MSILERVPFRGRIATGRGFRNRNGATGLQWLASPPSKPLLFVWPKKGHIRLLTAKKARGRRPLGAPRRSEGRKLWAFEVGMMLVALIATPMSQATIAGFEAGRPRNRRFQRLQFEAKCAVFRGVREGTTHLCFDSDLVAKQAKCSRAVRRFFFGQQVLLQRGNVSATMALVGSCWQMGCGRDELGLPTTLATLFGG